MNCIGKVFLAYEKLNAEGDEISSPLPPDSPVPLQESKGGSTYFAGSTGGNSNKSESCEPSETETPRSNTPYVGEERSVPFKPNVVAISLEIGELLGRVLCIFSVVDIMTHRNFIADLSSVYFLLDSLAAYDAFVSNHRGHLSTPGRALCGWAAPRCAFASQDPRAHTRCLSAHADPDGHVRQAHAW